MCERVDQALQAAQTAQALNAKPLKVPYFKPAKDDDVNHPNHYNQGNIEVYDFIDDQKLDFTEGCVVKYVCRYKTKNGLKDLKKARWYLDKLIKRTEMKEIDC